MSLISNLIVVDQTEQEIVSPGAGLSNRQFARPFIDVSDLMTLERVQQYLVVTRTGPVKGDRVKSWERYMSETSMSLPDLPPIVPVYSTNQRPFPSSGAANSCQHKAEISDGNVLEIEEQYIQSSKPDSKQANTGTQGGSFEDCEINAPSSTTDVVTENFFWSSLRDRYQQR